MKKTVITRKVGKKKQHSSIFNKVNIKTETLEELVSELKAIKPANEKIFDYIKSSTSFFEGYLKEKNLPYIYPKSYEYEINGRYGKAHLPEILKYITQDEGITLQPEWYAASFIQHAHELREWMRKGDLYESVHCTLLLEKDRFDFNQSHFEAKIIAGNSRVSNTSIANIKNAKSNQALAQPLFNSHIQRGFSNSRAAEFTSNIIREEQGITISPRTIREWKTKKLI